MNKDSFIKGLRDGIPIFLGYLAVSFTLGIAAKNAGLSAWQATLASMTSNASAGEFAAFTLIAGGAGYLEMAVTQLVVNIRYLLMSCALSQKIDAGRPYFHRFLIGFGLTDEIFGISSALEGKLNPFYTYGAICVALPGWALGTFLGVVSGSILPARAVSALSVALFGMFISIIVPPAKKNKVIAGLIVIAMASSWLFTKLPLVSQISSGFRVIILTVVIAGAAAIFFPVEEKEEDCREA